MMNSSCLRILKHVAKHREITLNEAVNFASRKAINHKEQYPLALLISQDFLGMSVPFPTMDGTERMPELNGAVFLHMNRLKRNEYGIVEYAGMTSSGADFSQERVFIRAKGALYLDEMQEKWKDRVVSFLVGFLAAIIPIIFAAIIPSIF